MKNIRTWRVYEVQNPGDLDKDGIQKRRAFIALSPCANPYETYGILPTTSYKNNKINNELILSNLLNNNKENKILPNNLVKIYNSNIIAPYYQKQNNKKSFVDITSENRNKIIQHFNLQHFRTIKDINFYSLEKNEKIDYYYQADSLINGIKENFNHAYNATENFIDHLQKEHIETSNNIILDNETFIQLRKDRIQLNKTYNKINELNLQIKKLRIQILTLQKENNSEYEMEI